MLTFPKLGLPLAPGGNSGFAGFLLPDSSRCEKDAVPKCPGPHLSFLDRKSTRLNSSHGYISYAVFCLKKKNRLHVIGLLGSRQRQRLTAPTAFTRSRTSRLTKDGARLHDPTAAIDPLPPVRSCLSAPS